MTAYYTGIRGAVVAEMETERVDVAVRVARLTAPVHPFGESMLRSRVGLAAAVVLAVARSRTACVGWGVLWALSGEAALIGAAIG